MGRRGGGRGGRGGGGGGGGRDQEWGRGDGDGGGSFRRERDDDEERRDKKGGFNKHTGGLQFVKQVPKFLQEFGKRSTDNAEALKAGLKLGQARPAKDDEQPIVANLEEFVAKNNTDASTIHRLLRGEDEDDEEGSSSLDALAALGQKHNLLSETPAASSAPASASDSTPATNESATAKKLLALSKRSLKKKEREEDAETDALEAELNCHLFRPSKKSSTEGTSSKDKKSQKEKSKQDKAKLTFQDQDEVED